MFLIMLDSSISCDIIKVHVSNINLVFKSYPSLASQGFSANPNILNMAIRVENTDNHDMYVTSSTHG